MNKRKITSKKRVKRDLNFYIKLTRMYHSKSAKRLRFYLRKLYRSFGITNIY